MKTLHLQFEKSFYRTWGLVTGLTALLTLVPAVLIPGGWSLLIPLLSLLVLWIPYREWRHAVRTVDDQGVIRHDGTRLRWSELQRLQPVHRINQWGQPGVLNHLDLHFSSGRARILPMVLEPGYAAIQQIQAWHRDASAAATTPVDRSPASPAPAGTVAEVTPSGPCAVCGTLGRHHRAIQKHGREAEDSVLPEAVKHLKFVQTLRPGHTRSPELLQCPACAAHFLYEVDYEYLATGSEDEQSLTRLSPEEAAALLHPPASG